MPTEPENTVETPKDWTVVVSGPLAQKGPLLASLERAGVDISDQPDRNPQYGLEAPDPQTGWVTCRTTGHVDQVVEHASRAGWGLRAHWPTPPCQACSGSGKDDRPLACTHCHGTGHTNRPAPTPEQLLRADLEQMRAELAALKARV